ncbi:MAG: PAS domain S-box protein [Candidatus Kapabacteria bacterium]|nr:PAS domain S-box protein [Candidatus Kapabacteria bacterium]
MMHRALPSATAANSASVPFSTDSDDLFRAVFESSTDALFLSTDEDDSLIIECNQPAIELFEAPTKQSLVGISGVSLRVIPLSAEELRKRSLELQIEGMIYAELEYKTLTGRVFWAAHLAKRLSVGDHFIRVTRITDISRRKAIEEDLRNHKAMLEEAQHIANIGSWEFDIPTQEIRWSDETFRLFGMEPQSQSPTLEEYMAMVSEEDKVRAAGLIGEAVRMGTPYKMEIRIIGRDGVSRYQEARGKAVKSASGEVVKLFGTVRDITERRLQSKALQESEMRLRNIIDNTNAIIATIAFDGTITFASNTFQTALGFASEEVVGKNFQEFLHPEHSVYLGELMIQGARGENEGSNLELRVYHRNGVWLWFNIITSLVRDDHGAPSHFVAIARDISEQKKLAEKLRRSEESLAEAQRMAHLGSWYVDLANNAMEWSDELYRILGVQRNATPFDGRGFLEIVHPLDKSIVREGLGRAVHHQEMLQEEVRILRNGSLRWLDVRVKPVTDADGNTTALFGTVWDITERKVTDQQIRALNLTLEERVQDRTQQLEEANKQLRSSQSNLKTLIESTNDAIWSIDRGYCLTAMNAACYSLLTVYNNYREAKLGMNSLYLMPGASSDEWKGFYDTVLMGDRFTKHLRYEIEELIADYEISFNPIIDEHGDITGAVIYSRDISVRKQAEDEIKRALEQERELSALKSRFVVMVSHEFRTPLTTIRASAELLERLRERLAPEKQTEYLHDILQAVDTMSHLLEDVLYLGKADAKGLDFAPSSINLSKLCENVINGFEIVPENEHRIVAHITGGLPKLLWLDEKLLRHIMTNLLSNALKYSPKDIPIEFRIHFMPDGDGGGSDVAKGSKDGQSAVRLSVKDSGIGISDEDLRHLFEPFYRASNVGNISGTGLGLAIVKQAVQAHQGTITCRSTIGAGTEFIVVIPCRVS